MAENEVIEPSKTKYNRQPPSIPFLWEERPGVAKKDWRPVVSSVTLAPPSPEKLVASVPFNWKEKPGKPLSCFSQPSIDSALTAWKASQQHNDYNFDNKESGGNDNHRHKGTFDLDLESFSFETDDSFSSAPSLLANCRVLSSAVSTAVPVLKTSSKIDINDQLEIPSSSASESDSSASSYETDISSLTGASFLECLFPLYPPNSGFPGKVEYSNNGSHTPLELKNKHFDHESCSNAMAKRPPTLGELIMMSRGRSCQRKAVQMRKKNLSMEFINGKAFACCVFGAGIKMIGGLQTKRHHPKLKLI
ncbi:hypothetical protein P3X46_030656 [Hevea brasiliensis]|uniref:VAN3-binding protein-like auxin canalisation domain-containing protein n=1 Tax=Hevea brasiliensis TaxID=3981 RepID=A0ABQ9KL09_HEVBR|nr:uncharacterized protein LOC110670214 [Hevea brasiliensis]KAJ9139965.1 hypothetical protein P3X46_030656 [Hevea brasiliensis]